MKEYLTASTTVAEVLLKRPFAARILVNHHMHCVGCAIAPFETLAAACEIYGVSLRGRNRTIISKITRSVSLLRRYRPSLLP
jgi:hybrid cluster-associated redox disulfide protein